MAEEITDEQAQASLDALERAFNRLQTHNPYPHLRVVLAKWREIKANTAKLEKDNEALKRQTDMLLKKQPELQAKVAEYDKQANAEMDEIANKKEQAKVDFNRLLSAVERAGEDLKNIEVEKQAKLADMGRAIAAEQAKLDKVTGDVNKFVNRLTATRP